MMIEFVAYSVCVALAACWLVLVAGKTGFREWVEVHAPGLVSEMAGCDFCLCWWTCLAVSAGIALWEGDPCRLLCAFCAAPVARFLIS